VKLDELLEKTPEQLRPIVRKYGPALAAMTAQEFCDWLELLILGRDDEAWLTLLAKADNRGLLEAWKTAAASWDAANTDNARSLQLQKEATLAVLKVLLGASLAWVGL
jgi:hypothetical protein